MLLLMSSGAFGGPPRDAPQRASSAQRAEGSTASRPLPEKGVLLARVLPVHRPEQQGHGHLVGRVLAEVHVDEGLARVVRVRVRVVERRLELEHGARRKNDGRPVEVRALPAQVPVLDVDQAAPGPVGKAGGDLHRAAEQVHVGQDRDQLRSRRQRPEPASQGMAHGAGRDPERGVGPDIVGEEPPRDGLLREVDPDLGAVRLDSPEERAVVDLHEDAGLPGKEPRDTVRKEPRLHSGGPFPEGVRNGGPRAAEARVARTRQGQFFQVPRNDALLHVQERVMHHRAVARLDLDGGDPGIGIQVRRQHEALVDVALREVRG